MLVSVRRSLFVLALVACSVRLVAAPEQAAADHLPNPIDPGNGELALLDTVNSLPLNDIAKALDNYPVPYVVVASAGGAPAQVFNNKAGVPTNVDADLSKATGKGGHDIKVEVNTVLLPTPRLVLTVQRLGVAPFATDVEVLIAFPFNAFNTEDAALPGDPNLFIGYHTTAADGSPGGIAPAYETFTFTPAILAGTAHTFELQMGTMLPANPMMFLAGHFDGTNLTGILNSSGIAALVDPVPATIGLGIDVNEDALLDGDGIDSFFDISWTATARADVRFSYFEEETGVPSDADAPDYGTTIDVHMMPTSETISFSLDEDNNLLTLGLHGNAVIDDITVLHHREDGLSVVAVASDVPTDVDISVNTDPKITIDVNDNTMDLTLQAVRLGGFLSTSAFFGYDIGYLEARAENVPDLEAEWEDGTDRYVARALNPGESIGSISLLLDDGPVAVVDGKADVNGDGVVDGTDDGTIAGIAFIDGMVDINDDGVIDASDDGDIPGAEPTGGVLDGLIDLNDDGSVGPADDGLLTILQLPPSWDDVPQHHILSLVDDGTQGTVAGRLTNVSLGALDLDGPTVIDGAIDLDGNGVVDANDDGPIAVSRVVIDGLIDWNGNGVIDAGDDGKDFGHRIINGAIDLDDNDVVNANDDGVLSVQTFEVASTATTPMQTHLVTATTSLFFPGRKIRATCDVDDFPDGLVRFQVVLPPPDINFNYQITPPQGIDQVSCAGNVDNVHFEVLAQDLPAARFEFDYDPDSHLTVEAEELTGVPNSGEVGALVLRLCDDPDEDGVCEVGEDGPVGLPGTGSLLGIPLRDARARADHIPSFAGTWSDGAATAIDGRVDLNGDAAITGLDTGSFGGAKINSGLADVPDGGWLAGKRVTGGRLDVDADGDVDGNDDGPLTGSHVKFDTGVPDAALYLDGIQIAASTQVGLTALAVASPSADHYLTFRDLGSDVSGPLEKRFAAGAFGIDEIGYTSDDGGRFMTASYRANEAHRLVVDIDSAFGGRFFPAYDVDVTLTVNKVPASMDLATDLESQFLYSGSAGINGVDLVGSIDDTNDPDPANGTNININLDALPASVRLFVESDARGIVDGRLNVKEPPAIDAADDDIFAGVRIIDGGVDLNGDGAVDANDDGRLIGVAVIDGLLDVDGSGTVDGNDDGKLGGATFDMNAPIDLVSVDLRSTNKIIGSDYQLIDLDIANIPASWVISFGGDRFLVESRNAGGNPSPLGSIQGVVSTSSAPAVNASKREPFTLDGDQLGGPVLGVAGTAGGCRVNYAQFLQEIDKRYYNAAPDPDPSAVFSRLGQVYCDSEQLDPGEDHIVVRLEDIDGDSKEEEAGYVSFKFTGFQHISWTPDKKGGQFVFRAPSAGLHPIFAGFEQDDVFGTLQVKNIPDEVIVDFDKDGHLTYDAHDDVDASVQQIDVYYGPLPMANDDATAVRAVLDFNGPVVSTDDFVHIGWKLEFPEGGAYFNASEPFEVLFLYQDGGNRVTGGLSMEDLQAAWGLDLFSFEVTDEQEIFPYPCPELEDPFKICWASIPVQWELLAYEAGVDNDADAEPLGLPLAENPAKEDVAGFLAVYERRNDIQDLTPASGVPFTGTEYVPLVTVEGEGFRIGTIKAQVVIDPLQYADVNFCVLPFACVGIKIPIELTGNVTLDYWWNADKSWTVGPVSSEVTGEIFPEIGFRNNADYRENDPFHIIPIDSWFGGFSVEPGTLVLNWDGFHDFGEHFDPLN